MRLVFSLFTFLFLGLNLARAQMVVTVVPILNTSGIPDKIDFKFYVRSSGTPFELGACNFVFDYDNTAIQTGSAILAANHLTGGCPNGAPCFDMTATNTPGFLNLTVAPYDYNQSVTVAGVDVLVATVRCNILDCNKNIALTANSIHNYSKVNTTFDDFTDITSSTTFNLPTAFPLRPQLHFIAPKDTSVCSGANVTFYTEDGVLGDFYIGIPGVGSRTPLVANSWNASHTFTFPGPGTRVDTIILTTRNVAGNTYCEDLLLVTVNPLPAVPTATAATGINCTGFTANWTSVSGATDYRLDVATDAGFSSMVSGYNDLSVGIVTVYNVTGLSLGTTYYYRVRSVNGCGSSANSGTITVTTNSLPATPTANPASAINCTGFTANWNTAAGASTYTLDVATDAGFSSPITGSPFVGITGSSQVISGLSLGTTYYYRVRSVNGCGSSANSGTITVTTNSLPATPTANPASAINCTGFTANWNTAAGASTYTLDVATDAGFSSPITGSPFVGITGSSQVISGLSLGTTYYYRVRSVNGCGVSVNSNVITVTTDDVPAVPTATAATGINCTGFTANWTSVSGATDYRLDVATDAGFSSMVSGYNDLSVGIVTVYNVTGLSLGTTYYYRVRSVNGCGSSANSGTITVTTNSLPATPTANPASAINCTGFTANWASVIGATNYTLEVSLDAGHSSPVSGSPFTVSGTGQVITGLSAGTTYYFRVRSNNACGSSAFTANETVTTNAISGVPTGLSSSAINCTGFTANWASVIGATNYTLEVSLDAGHSSPVSGSPFTVSGTSQVITGLSAGTTYYFRVRSNNACGSSAFTANETVTTNAISGVPTGLSSSAINCTGFTANWASVIGATNYTLEVSLDAGHSSPVSGSPFTVSGTSQVITGLSAGTTYYFRVRSNNACGSSTFTANETVTTNAISGVPTGLSSSGVSCTGFTANWTSVIGATNYTLEVSLDAGHSSPVSGSPFTVSGTGQVITGLTPSTTYYFRVRSNNACGSSAFTGNQMVITTAGTMPSFIAPTITVWENQKQVTYTTNIACDWVLSGCTSTSPLLGTTSIVVDFDLPGIATITATPSSVTCPISGNLSLMVLPTYKIDVRVWLEGPYSGGTMTVSAIRNGQLNSAWGGIMTPTRPDTFGWPDTAMTNSYNVPANAIDLILLELRTGTALATKVDTALAWLMNDGTVRDFATGTKSYAELRRNAGGTYYVVVRSRNHAPIRSANSAAITNVAGGPGTLFDMKTAAGISNPSLNAKDLGGGQLGMYAGQVNPIFGRKNEINSVDFFYVRKRAAGAPVGYLIEDVNDDGVCNAADYILTSQNNDYLRRSDVDD